ncbi:phosphoesterase, MJ0936 family [Bryocella elongata]|uniref:Phosphoesterase, MJ0936 family n=1 Tax=Bryocella elongata TaxID=863522 RepID=A0A1H5TQ64_9BACT|nr:metallophosphoesterase family protein [Bryocella elongata]SEF64221.1 phosphoesterase, MJ0936 family [Bryocella elongata]
MRIAILSDIHGNLTALKAVQADLRDAAPDLILHGGDLADGGSSPAEVVDTLRESGCAGVMGNGDEMLARPAALEEFAECSAGNSAMWDVVRSMAASTRERLGDERLAWLASHPYQVVIPELALVHATPASCWRAAPPNASEADLEVIYAPLERSCVVFGHTHVPSVRTLGGVVSTLINCGSVGLPFDGDPRASYLLFTAGRPLIRRVPYDVEAECDRLRVSGLPAFAWTAAMLRAASPRLP